MPTRLVFEEVVVADARIREASNERRLVAHRATIDGVVVQLLPALRWHAMRFTAQLFHHTNACSMCGGQQQQARDRQRGDLISCQLGHTLQVAVLPNGHESPANVVLQGGLLCVEHAAFSRRAPRERAPAGRHSVGKKRKLILLPCKVAVELPPGPANLRHV